MKAILVIDMPNDIDISKVRIGGDGNIYFMRDGEKASIVGNIRNIKPLPQKKNTSKLQSFSNSQILWTDKVVYQNEGWNACLEEIAGETK